MLEVDREYDLALIQIPTSGLTALPLGDSKKVQLAQDVRVVGFPLSDVLGNSIKVNRGTVSGMVDHEDGAVDPNRRGRSTRAIAAARWSTCRGEVVGVANAKLAACGDFQRRLRGARRKGPRTAETPGDHRSGRRGRRRRAGPDLAKRVTPGVALVTVTVGPGRAGQRRALPPVVQRNLREVEAGKPGTATARPPRAVRFRAKS